MLPSIFPVQRCLFAVIVMTILPVQANCFAMNEDLFRQATEASDKRQFAEAERLMTRHIADAPDDAVAYYRRGRDRFCQGKITESVADFDKYVKLAPSREIQLWERGISLYYAGEFERGAKQFELYQSYHDADVENAAWRYLCQARATDTTKARADLLPIKGDRRPVLMDIYAMFKGEKTPEQVLQVAATVKGDDAEKKIAHFYAHLYIGIFHEAHGDAEKSLKHMDLAANKYFDPHYMGDVAVVHRNLRTKKAAPAGESKPKAK